MRLIDADALVSALNNGRFKEQTGRAVPFNAVPFNAGVAFALTMVEYAPTIYAVPCWIPCEEGLPEPNVAVLGYAPKFDNIFAVYYDSVCGWMTWCPVCDNPFPSFQDEIVAWMPLPEPYKGERKDDE